MINAGRGRIGVPSSFPSVAERRNRVAAVAANVLPPGPRFGGGLVMLNLDSRLGVLRRRRRVNRFKQLLTIIPVLLGASFILLLAYAGMATSR